MNTEGTGFCTCKECHTTESLSKHTTIIHKEKEQSGDQETLARAAVTLETERTKWPKPWCLRWWWWYIMSLLHTHTCAHTHTHTKSSFSSFLSLYWFVSISSCIFLPVYTNDSRSECQIGTLFSVVAHTELQSAVTCGHFIPYALTHYI